MKNLESIKLKKFGSSTLNPEHMGVIRGGQSMPLCTGGGFSNNWARDGSGSYVLLSTHSWDSDTEYDNGFKLYKNSHLEYF